MPWSSFPIRTVIRMSVCLAASLAGTVSFGATASRPQVPAQLLDRAAFLCDNCFFGASDYYYCFAVDNKVLIGYQRAPVLNWRDKSKNYLTGFPPRMGGVERARPDRADQLRRQAYLGRPRGPGPKKQDSGRTSGEWPCGPAARTANK